MNIIPLLHPAFLERRIRPLIMIVLALAIGPKVVHAQTSPVVWTQHNDNGRTGNNPSEVLLMPQKINHEHFGKLFTYELDDETYSQPLYVPGVTMAADGRAHNIVFIATVNNTVYAFDADSNAVNGGKPLWKQSLTPGNTRPPNAAELRHMGACDFQYRDFAGNIGIVGTPVIDTGTRTLYVVARTVESGNRWVQRLHALDLSNGLEKFGGPVITWASYKGVEFDPVLNNQRTALALVNGSVYVGWASHCDFGDYHGWIIGYKGSDLSQIAVWSSTAATGGSQGGVWQSGQGPAADSAGNLYLLTGNGTFDGADDFGESAVKLSLSNGRLRVSNFFTPWNYLKLNKDDDDFGSSGILAIPGTRLLAAGGKQGVLYILDIDNLGGISEAAPDHVVQEFQATFPSGPTGHIHGSPVYFDAGAHKYLYLWGENDFLRVFEMTGATNAPFNSTPIAISGMRAPQVQTGMPGGFLSVSSSGNSNGIVWALAPYGCNANQHIEPGILYAFDASTFSGASGATRKLIELWDTKQNVARDELGYYAKFTYPTIANGKVYVAAWGNLTPGTFDCSGTPEPPPNRGQLVVYGLLP